MFQSMSTMPSMPPMRPMAPMPAMSPMLPMPTIQLPPQYDRTQNHIVQYPKVWIRPTFHQNYCSKFFEFQVHYVISTSFSNYMWCSSAGSTLKWSESESQSE